VVVSISVLAAVPPVSRDALIHHLAVPTLYLQHGGIYDIPGAKFSYYPMNLDLLYMIPLYLGNDIVPKYIHFGFALLTAAMLFGFLKKRLSLNYALFGILLFLSLPAIVRLSITAYVDLGLIFFSFAALVFFLKWVEHRFQLRYLLVSALCCGLALGTKYNGLITLFLLTLCAVFIKARSVPSAVSNQLRALGVGALYLAVALLVFSPWAVRNYHWTGNPIYPLYNSWVQSKSAAEPGAGGEKVAAGRGNGWSHFAVRKVIFKETWWQIALIPVRIFFQGRDDDPKYFDGRLNPLLFFLPFFAFHGLKQDSQRLQTEKKILLAFAGLFILFVFFQGDMRIRYIGPAVPPLVVLAVMGLHRLGLMAARLQPASRRKIMQGLILGAVTILVGLDGAYVYSQFKRVKPLDFISGRVGRDAYIQQFRPEYAAIRYANQQLPADARILGIFLGNRSYYSQRQIIFDFQWLTSAFADTAMRQSAADLLAARGITHLLIRHDLFDRWVANNFTDSEKERLHRFFQEHTRLLFSKSGYGLYVIRRPSVSSRRTKENRRQLGLRPFPMVKKNNG